MNLLLCPPYLHEAQKIPLTDIKIRRLTIKSLHSLGVTSVP